MNDLERLGQHVGRIRDLEFGSMPHNWSASVSFGKIGWNGRVEECDQCFVRSRVLLEIDAQGTARCPHKSRIAA